MRKVVSSEQGKQRDMRSKLKPRQSNNLLHLVTTNLPVVKWIGEGEGGGVTDNNQLNCRVADDLPLSIILGTVIVRQTDANDDFRCGVLLLKACVASIAQVTVPVVPVTPITVNRITFHSMKNVTLQPNSETMTECIMKLEKPCAHTLPESPNTDILQVQKTDLYVNNKLIIVKPIIVPWYNFPLVAYPRHPPIATACVTK